MSTLLYIMTTIRSGFLLTPSPTRMTLNEIERRIYLKVRLARFIFVVAFRADNA